MSNVPMTNPGGGLAVHEDRMTTGRSGGNAAATTWSSTSKTAARTRHVPSRPLSVNLEDLDIHACVELSGITAPVP
jgi:hypothetical protein